MWQRGVTVPVALALAMAVGVPVSAHPGIDEQIEAVTARIAEHPSDAALYLQRGELHRMHQEADLAEADYRQALEIDPGLLRALHCLGMLKLDQGQPAEAKRLLDRYLAERPKDPDALATRAQALADLGKPLEAARDFTASIAHPDKPYRLPELYLERARTLASAGSEHVPEAIRGLDEGIERLGDPVTLELYAVDLELSLERWDSAVARIDRLAADSARKEPWLVRKGAILESAGRLDEARQAYREALESLEAVPAARKTNAAVQRIEAEARTALARLDDTAAR